MFTWLVHWLLLLLFLCNSSAAGGSKGKTSTPLLTLQTAAFWTGLAIRCPFPSEISVKHELGILIPVMRYFYLLKSVIRAEDSLPYPPRLRFTQFALRALQLVDDDHKIFLCSALSLCYLTMIKTNLQWICLSNVPKCYLFILVLPKYRKLRHAFLSGTPAHLSVLVYLAVTMWR